MSHKDRARRHRISDESEEVMYYKSSPLEVSAVLPHCAVRYEQEVAYTRVHFELMIKLQWYSIICL
jgi:hypothetical protein